MEKEKKTKKQRNAERQANKKVREQIKQAAKVRSLLPIGGKCPDCGLRVRTNTMDKHRAGMSHKMRMANKNAPKTKTKVRIYK